MSKITPIDWLLSDDTGISSKTILAVMTGSNVSRYSRPPADPSDFGRCYRLLQLFPDWRARLNEVADKFPSWAGLVKEWDELTAMYEEEIAGNTGKAPRLYKRMRELLTHD